MAATQSRVDGASQVDLTDEERQRNVFWNPFIVFQKESLEKFIRRLSAHSAHRQTKLQRKVTSSKRRLSCRKLPSVEGREMVSDILNSDHSSMSFHKNENADEMTEMGVKWQSNVGFQGSRSPSSTGANDIRCLDKEITKVNMYVNNRPNSLVPSTIGLNEIRDQDSHLFGQLNQTQNTQPNVRSNSKNTFASHSGILKKNMNCTCETGTEIDGQLDEKCRVVYQNEFIVYSADEKRNNLEMSASVGGMRGSESNPQPALWSYDSILRHNEQAARRHQSTDRMFSTLHSYDMPADLRLNSLMERIVCPQVDSFDQVKSGSCNCHMKKRKSDSRKLSSCGSNQYISWVDYVRPPSLESRSLRKQSNSTENTRTNNVEHLLPQKHSLAAVGVSQDKINASSVELALKILNHPNAANSKQEQDSDSEILIKNDMGVTSSAFKKPSKVGFKLIPRVTFIPQRKRGTGDDDDDASASATTGRGSSSAKRRKRRRRRSLQLTQQVLLVIQELLQQIEDLEQLLSRLQGREEDLRHEMEALLQAYEESWKKYLRTLSQYGSCLSGCCCCPPLDTSDFSSALQLLLSSGVAQVVNCHDAPRDKRRMILL